MSERPTPVWPDDVLYLPVENNGKGPDGRSIPGTWGYDGTGCTKYENLTERRWAIVDVDVDEWRLLIVDLDIHKMESERAERVKNAISDGPETRVHKSQSGGLHVFYWLLESELNDDGKLPVLLEDEIDDKLNGYVLSPYCDGYSVFSDRDVATISVDELPDEWVSGERYQPSEGDGISETVRGRENLDEVSVFDVISRSAHPEGKRVEHPIHGSSTGTNFMVDPGADTWRCWRHDCTGNALHLVGMDAGIIDCGDWLGAGLSSEKWASILQECEERGLIAPTPGSLDTDAVEENAYILSERRTYPTIEEAELPKRTSFVLRKSPRAGGSHLTLSNFIEWGDPIFVLGGRHKTLSQHLDTVSKMLSEDQCAVHIEGSNRVCESGSGHCQKYPDGEDERYRMLRKVKTATEENTTLTAEDAPDDVCRAFFVKAAAEYCDVVLTVPQLIHDLTVPDKARLFFDEEYTLDYFYPPSIDLGTLYTSYEPDGTKTVGVKATEMIQLRDGLESVRDAIKQAQQKRKEQAEKEGRDWRRNAFETDMLAVIDIYVDEICPAFGVTDAKESIIESGDDISLGTVADEIESRLEDISFHEPTADPKQLFEKIREYTAKFNNRDDTDIDPGAALLSLLYPYREQPFHFKQRPGEVVSRLVGDRGRDPFFKDWLESFEQIGMIAGPSGERFIDKLDFNACAVELETFPYVEQFMVLPVGRKYDGQITPLEEQRDVVDRVIKILNRRHHPLMAVTGTSDEAKDLVESLTESTADLVQDPADMAPDMRNLWSTGSTLVFFENGIISRGVDAPYFDATAVRSTGFADPYWEARQKYYDGESDEYLEAVAVQQEREDRELTNAALRMSHTYTTHEDLGTKIIVCAFDDAKHIQYLQDRMLPRVATAKRAANIVEELTISGGMAKENRMLYEILGRSDKAYIEETITTEMSERVDDRPRYDIDSVRGWLENRHVSRGDTQEVLNAASSCQNDPTTDDILRRLPGWSKSRLTTILTILKKKGIVDSYQESDGSKGRNPNKWKIDSLSR